MDALFYPDHHNWTPDELTGIFKKMKSRSCRDLIVTEKDKVKLEQFAELFAEYKIDLWVFEIELKILEMEDLFIDGLMSKMGLSGEQTTTASN